MTALLVSALRQVAVIDDGVYPREVYEHDGRHAVVLYSSLLTGFTAYRSNRTGDTAGLPLIEGCGRTRGDVIRRLELLAAAGEL